MPEIQSRSYANPRRLPRRNHYQAAEFRRRDVWPLSHGQVDRLLARHGSHRPSYVRTPGPRYERASVNELWHIDLKGPFILLGQSGLARCGQEPSPRAPMAQAWACCRSRSAVATSAASECFRGQVHAERRMKVRISTSSPMERP